MIMSQRVSYSFLILKLVVFKLATDLPDEQMNNVISSNFHIFTSTVETATLNKTEGFESDG